MGKRKKVKVVEEKNSKVDLKFKFIKFCSKILKIFSKSYMELRNAEVKQMIVSHKLDFLIGKRKKLLFSKPKKKESELSKEKDGSNENEIAKIEESLKKLRKEQSKIQDECSTKKWKFEAKKKKYKFSSAEKYFFPTLRDNQEQQKVLKCSNLLIVEIGRLHLNRVSKKEKKEKLKKLENELFPKGIEKHRNYHKFFLDFIQNFHTKDLREFYKSNVTKTDANRTKRKLGTKTEFIDWIYCRMFGFKTSIEKRELEERNLQDFRSDSLFYILGKSSDNRHDLIVPFDVMQEIVSFMEKDLSFLNSFGLVNENFYILSLLSFRMITINKKNCLKIPVLVLNNVSFISLILSTSFYVKELRFIFQNAKELKTLEVTGNQFPKIISAITKKPKLQFPSVRTVRFSKNRNTISKKKDRIKNFVPICFPNANRIFGIEDEEKFEYKETEKIKIKTLKLRVLSLWSEEWNVKSSLNCLGLFELSNLEALSLHIYGKKEISFLNRVSKTLKKLEISIKRTILKEKKVKLSHTLKKMQSLEQLSISIPNDNTFGSFLNLDLNAIPGIELMDVEFFRFLENISSHLKYLVLQGMNILQLEKNGELFFRRIEKLGFQFKTKYKNIEKLTDDKAKEIRECVIPYLKSFESLTLVLVETGASPHTYYSDGSQDDPQYIKFCEKNGLKYIKKSQICSSSKQKIMKSKGKYFSFNTFNDSKLDQKPCFYQLVHINSSD